MLEPPNPEVARQALRIFPWVLIASVIILGLAVSFVRWIDRNS
jgi:hypothetical protein